MGPRRRHSCSRSRASSDGGSSSPASRPRLLGAFLGQTLAELVRSPAATPTSLTRRAPSSRARIQPSSPPSRCRSPTSRRPWRAATPGRSEPTSTSPRRRSRTRPGGSSRSRRRATCSRRIDGWNKWAPWAIFAAFTLAALSRSPSSGGWFAARTRWPMPTPSSMRATGPCSNAPETWSARTPSSTSSPRSPPTTSRSRCARCRCSRSGPPTWMAICSPSRAATTCDGARTRRAGWRP